MTKWNPFRKKTRAPATPRAASPAPAPSTPARAAPPKPSPAVPTPRRIDPRDPARPIEILLVEDNPNDVELMREGLIESKVANRVNHVRDGVEAMDYLYRRGAFSSAPLPDIIFLDLNMPRKNGREVLAEVKADPKLKHIPVVILTTSSAEEDILRSYRLQAAAYVMKPVDFAQFLKVMRAIENFWFHAVAYANPPE